MPKKNKNKYNKRLRYLEHYFFENLISENINAGIKFSIISTLIMGLLCFLHGDASLYPTEIIPLDFSMTICFFLFLMIKPLLYNGRIKAYYRKDYSFLYPILRFYLILAISSILRSLIVSFSYLLNVFGNYYNNQKEIIQALFNIYNKNITFPVLIISLALFYFTYFQDKFIEIKEYSNKVIGLMKNHNYDKYKAIATVINNKNIEYGICEYDGNYYDDKKNTIEDDLMDELKALNKKRQG